MKDGAYTRARLAPITIEMKKVCDFPYPILLTDTLLKNPSEDSKRIVFS